VPPRIDDPASAFKAADRRLRELLFGDGIDHAGMVKGEERREQVGLALRRMRAAFDAALAAAVENRDAVTRVADLEEELLKRASTRATRAGRTRKRAS
jgi:hypothetical protein